MVFEANLLIPAARALGSEDRTRALRSRSRTTLAVLCERAGIRLRVERALEPVVALWDAWHHGYTVDDRGVRAYAISRHGLPQRDPERSARIIEILAYGCFDYAARESVCERGIFVYPVTPDHGRAWLSKIGRRGGSVKTHRKQLTSRANGQRNV